MNAWGIILIAIGAVMFWYATKQNVNLGQVATKVGMSAGKATTGAAVSVIPGHKYITNQYKKYLNTGPNAALNSLGNQLGL